MARSLRACGNRGTGWFGTIGVAAVLAVVGWMGSARAARAQEEKPAKPDEKLPKAEAVIDKAIEALGGKAAIEKIHSRVLKGTIEIVGQDTKGSVTIYAAAPNKRYMQTELPGVGKMEDGTDGEVFWRLNAAGPSVLEGEQRAMSKRQTTFNNELYWKKLYQKVECVGVDTIDDHPCYKVVRTPPEGEGNPETVYYDRNSGLPLKTVLTIKGPMGDMTLEVVPSEYKKIDGVSFAQKMTQKNVTLKQSFVMTFDSIENNVDIPAERFALPDAVKALAAGEKSEPKPAGGEKGKPEKP